MRFPRPSSILCRLRALPAQARRTYHLLRGRCALGDLTALAQIAGTDKCTTHNYTPVYHRLLRHLRHRKIRLLEIGVGGEAKLEAGGESLRMWKSYFPRAAIFGVDIYDKSAHAGSRITILQADQSSPSELEKITRDHAPFDVVLDDGSHICSHVLTSFHALFPSVKTGGYYIIEDTQTSYWPTYGGDSADLDSTTSSLPFFKSLTDALNHQEILDPAPQLQAIGRQIRSIAFHHNLIIIHKAPNDEPGMAAEELARLTPPPPKAAPNPEGQRPA